MSESKSIAVLCLRFKFKCNNIINNNNNKDFIKFTYYYPRPQRGYCNWVRQSVCLSVCLSECVAQKVLIRSTSNFYMCWGVTVAWSSSKNRFLGQTSRSRSRKITIIAITLSKKGVETYG